MTGPHLLSECLKNGGSVRINGGYKGTVNPATLTEQFRRKYEDVYRPGRNYERTENVLERGGTKTLYY